MPFLLTLRGSGCPFSGLSSGQSGQVRKIFFAVSILDHPCRLIFQGHTVDRSLFEPEDFDRVSSGDSELAELLRQYDEDRVAEAGMTEEEDRADPDVDIGGRGGARRREGSFWLKWIDLYSDNGGKEEVRKTKHNAELCTVEIFFSPDARGGVRCGGELGAPGGIGGAILRGLSVRTVGRPAAGGLRLRHLSGVPESLPGQRQVLLELRGEEDVAHHINGCRK